MADRYRVHTWLRWLVAARGIAVGVFGHAVYVTCEGGGL
jgi:hypothetical protein